MLLKNCPNFFVCLSLCIFPQDFFKNYLQHDKELGFLCCTQSIITLHFSQQTIQSDYLTNFKGGGSFGNRQQQFFFLPVWMYKNFYRVDKKCQRNQIAGRIILASTGFYGQLLCMEGKTYNSKANESICFLLCYSISIFYTDFVAQLVLSQFSFLLCSILL